MHLLAFLLGAGLLYGLIVWIDDPSRTEALQSILGIWTIVVGIDLLIAGSYFLWPRKEKTKISA
ncbi:hypothetical protein D3C80_2118240 [compost metagenome]